MAKADYPLTFEKAQAFFVYDDKSGQLYWKRRSLDTFATERAGKVWNSNFAGTLVGTRGGRGGYIQFKYGTAFYMVHRVVWLMKTGEWPIHIDHMNGLTTDNRFENLRNVTNAENRRNMRRDIRRGPGVNGVRCVKGRWHARISANGKNLLLGTFRSFHEAVAIRKCAEITYGYHPNHGRAA